MCHSFNTEGTGTHRLGNTRKHRSLQTTPHLNQKGAPGFSLFTLSSLLLFPRVLSKDRRQ